VDTKAIETEQELTKDRILKFYEYVALHTPNMDIYARWVMGKHPTEEIITRYIENGAMFTYEKEEVLWGAMAVTMKQSEEYHAIRWKTDLPDDEVAVVHILAVNPNYQGNGIGMHMLEEAIHLAKASGKKAVRLDALATNKPAHALYYKMGFAYRGKQNLYADNTGWTDFFYFELEC